MNHAHIVSVMICFKGLSVFCFFYSSNRLNNLNATKEWRTWHFAYLLWYVSFLGTCHIGKCFVWMPVSHAKRAMLTLSVFLMHGRRLMFFPSFYKSLGKKNNESKMSEYHLHRVNLLPDASKAGQRVCDIHSSAADPFTGRPCWKTAPSSLNVDQRA